MDMELQHVTLEGYRPVFDGMFSQEETLESIVPDACPDISRIVSASGRAFLKEKELGEGVLRLTGTAKVTVLYIPEGGETPRALEVTIPFQCSRDDPGFHAGGSVRADVQLVSADARTLNPRKVLVRADLSFWAAVYDRARQELSCGASGGEAAGLETRLSEQRVFTVPEVREKSFAFSDVLRPPASRPEMDELLLYRAEMGTADAKSIGKKLVLKGDVQLSALYRGGDKLISARFEMPYSQILDLGELPEESEPDTAVALKAADCRMQNGEMEVTVELLAQAALWACQPVTLLTDAYGVGSPVDVERAPAGLCTGAERVVRREQVRTICETGIPAKQTLDCRTAVGELTSAPAEGGMEFTARVNCSVLYLSEDDELCGADTSVSVNCRVDLPAGGRCACRCRPVGEPAAVPVTGGLEIRAEVEFVVTLIQEEQVSCVVSLAPGTAGETGPRPSVVIRRVGEGESLWDVAKACGSTVADICGANGLPAAEAAPGTLLLVPAKRI